jgi:hypothetical protein
MSKLSKVQRQELTRHLKAASREIDELLAGETYGSSEEPPPPPRPQDPPAQVWIPDMTEMQAKVWDDPASFILLYGEKGSGKTIIAGHRIIRHAYENDNALVLIVAPSIRTGAEGIWYDIDSLLLPAWKQGIGLEYSDSKLDPNTKDRHRWILNRFGGWSKLLLISIPSPSQVADRIKGPAPSMVYVDELTNCRGREYFTFPSAQLGRRRGIVGPQQYIASCNPEGPSHWVYKVFFEECVNQETGVRDPRYAVYHLRGLDNRFLLRENPGYFDHLQAVLAGDEIERRRLIHGEWIDRPAGDAIFRGYYIPQIHVRGDALKGIGLRPQPGYIASVGYDLGQVHNSVTFMQLVPSKDKPVWIVFDEIDHRHERILYRHLARRIVERLNHWNRVCGTEFYYEHIADESAVNQWRPGGEGSFDAWDLERFSAGRIQIKGCPKGRGSVAARVRAVQSKLAQEELFVSDLCQHTKDCLTNLAQDEYGLPLRSVYLHKFDSMTYPMLYNELGPGSFGLPNADTRARIYQAGYAQRL